MYNLTRWRIIVEKKYNLHNLHNSNQVFDKKAQLLILKVYVITKQYLSSSGECMNTKKCCLMTFILQPIYMLSIYRGFEMFQEAKRKIN